MINFNDRADRLPSGIIVGSIVVIALTVMVMLLFPAPTAAGIAASHMRQEQTINTQIAEEHSQSETARQAIGPRVWRGGVDTVAAAILTDLTADARADKVMISAFRPQRTTDFGGIVELPISVQVSGAYRGVHALMSSLDRPNTKIVLSSAQLTASQASSNAINGMLGLSAYIVSDPSVLPASGASKEKSRHG